MVFQEDMFRSNSNKEVALSQNYFCGMLRVDSCLLSGSQFKLKVFCGADNLPLEIVLQVREVTGFTYKERPQALSV